MALMWATISISNCIWLFNILLGSLLVGHKCFNAVHSDDAGNARGHVMHELQASALHDRERITKRGPAKCDLNILLLVKPPMCAW